MSKIFETQFEKKSLLDKVSKGVMVNTAGTFVDTEKGGAMLFDGATSKLVLGNIGNIKAIAFFARLLTTTEQLFEGATNDKLIHNNAGTLTYSDFDNAFIDNIDTNTLDTNWHCILITSSTDVDCSAATLALNNTNYGNLYCAKVICYDSELTAQERSDLYKKFLHASNLAIQKVNPIEHTVNKPTDLSNETGLVAAYNMIPQNGELVDISGNGNNGTLVNSPYQTLEGLKFGLDSQYVQIAGNTLLNNATALSLCISFKANNIANNDGLIISRGASVSGLSFFPSNVIRLLINGTVINSAAIITTGQWMQASAIWDGVTQNGKIYINGVKVTDADLAETILSITDFWKLAIDDTIASRVLDGQIRSFKMYNTIISDQKAKDYHNSFAKQVILYEDFRYNNKDGITKSFSISDDIIINSGTFKLTEDTTSPYIECVTDGTFSYVIDLSGYSGNGYIKTLKGDLSKDEGDTVDNATNVAFTNNKITFTMTSGQKIREICITKAQEQ